MSRLYYFMLLVGVFCCSCSGGPLPEKEIIGKWAGTDGYANLWEHLEFFPEGTFSAVNEDGEAVAGDYKFIDKSTVRLDGRIFVLVGDVVLSKTELVIKFANGKTYHYSRIPVLSSLSAEEGINLSSPKGAVNGFWEAVESSSLETAKKYFLTQGENIALDGKVREAPTREEVEDLLGSLTQWMQGKKRASDFRIIKEEEIEGFSVSSAEVEFKEIKSDDSVFLKFYLLELKENYWKLFRLEDR